MPSPLALDSVAVENGARRRAQGAWLKADGGRLKVEQLIHSTFGIRHSVEE